VAIGGFSLFYLEFIVFFNCMQFTSELSFTVVVDESEMRYALKGEDGIRETLGAIKTGLKPQ